MMFTEALHNYKNHRLTAAALTLTMLYGTYAQAASRRVVLPTGTVIPVKLNNTLSSKTSRAGDRFTATVRYGKDDAGLPEGTKVEGVVREALPSADGKPGVVDVDLNRMVMPNGTRLAVDAGLIPISDKSVKRSSSGRLVATSNKSNDRLKFIGLGAGAGLLIGALTKGNTLTDVLLGAGAGYLYNEFGNKPKPGDVNLKPGDEFGIRLDRDFAFNTESSYRYSSTSTDDRYDNYPNNSNRDDRYYHEDDRNSNDGAYYDHPNTDGRMHRTTGDDVDRNDIGMMIDDRNVKFGSAKPFYINGTALVPLETVSREARFDYKYDANRRVVRARNGQLRMSIGSRIAVFKGERRRLPVAAEVRNGVVYVPMQFVAWAMNGSSYWDSGSRTVVITTDRE